MIDVEKIKGSGFTIITQDISPMTSLPEQSQSDINEMLWCIDDILRKHNFQIELILENEEAARLQARMMFNEFYKQADATYCERAGLI